MMHRVSDEIDRIRTQVVRDLTELPLAPWKRRLTRRDRAVRFAMRSWQRARMLVGAGN